MASSTREAASVWFGTQSQNQALAAIARLSSVTQASQGDAEVLNRRGASTQKAAGSCTAR